jgi:hypothetical protein
VAIVKILFMMDRRANRGSIQAVAAYVRAGAEAGHTVALYGRPDPEYPGVLCSTALGSFDYLVFICEFGVQWMSGLRMLRVVADVPRDHRAILDADGMYNPVISVDGYDRNHASEAERAWWTGHCDRVTDKILQPTQHTLGPPALPVPFYGYDQGLVVDARVAPPKRFDLLHVAHNWWRWREVSTSLLPAIERIRPEIKDIGFIGLWWDMTPAGARDQNLEIAFGHDTAWFNRLGINVRTAVPYTEVPAAMSEGRLNIMTQRPLFRRLRLLTSKFFEVFYADTIPLVMIDPDHAASVYGPAGRELALHGDVSGKILDALNRPMYYRDIVEEVRRHLAASHSYRNRLEELITALTTPSAVSRPAAAGILPS